MPRKRRPWSPIVIAPNDEVRELGFIEHAEEE
jgi:hypothetical protein